MIRGAIQPVDCGVGIGVVTMAKSSRSVDLALSCVLLAGLFHLKKHVHMVD